MSEPVTRVVLLGASNLTRGIAAVLRQARARLSCPLDVMVAFGHGRSYGIRSRVGFRELPGITGCALWTDLASRPRLPTVALVADLGNDLVYGVEPAAIAGFVRTCLERLAAHSARVTMVQLPTSTIAEISPAQHWLLRNVYFARHRLPLAAAQARAVELARLIETLGKAAGATLVEQEPGWFGFDPIHYPLAHWNAVWGRILAGWGEAAIPVGGYSLREWLYVRSRAPALRWLFGREHRRPQPAGRLACGSALSIY